MDARDMSAPFVISQLILLGWEEDYWYTSSQELGQAYPMSMLHMAAWLFWLCIYQRPHKYGVGTGPDDELLWCLTRWKDQQEVQGLWSLQTRWCNLHYNCTWWITIISNTVVTTHKGFFEAFSKDGMGKVPNKDVRVLTKQIVAAAEWLAKVSALPAECTAQILEGFTWYAVLIFKETFCHLLLGKHLRQLCTWLPYMTLLVWAKSRSFARRQTIGLTHLTYQKSWLFQTLTLS